MLNVQSINVFEQSEDVQFIDVREEWEFQTAKLPLFKVCYVDKKAHI